jgi:membrane-bound lytic murein transglycosylase D
MKQVNKYLFQIVVILCLFAVQFLYFEYRFFRFDDDVFDTMYELGSRMQQLSQRIDDMDEMMYAAERRSFVNIHKIPLPVTFCGDTLNYGDPVMRERVEREFFSMLDKQGQIQLYLKRSVKYFPMIESYLQAANLPDDLKYLAMHESALLPRIRSRSNAVGMWQFMRSTGRLYKLRIDRYVDERRDPQKATQAAMLMLQDLYNQFNNWPMVLAAYNGGLNRIKRSIRDQNSTSFFDLSLPEETERYYFKIVATKIIVSRAESFGFKLTQDELFHPVDITRTRVHIQEDFISLDQIASQHGLSLARFKDLNPHLISASLTQGIYTLNIPKVHIAKGEKIRYHTVDK